MKVTAILKCTNALVNTCTGTVYLILTVGPKTARQQYELEEFCSRTGFFNCSVTCGSSFTKDVDKLKDKITFTVLLVCDGNMTRYTYKAQLVGDQVGTGKGDGWKGPEKVGGEEQKQIEKENKDAPSKKGHP